MVDAIIDYLSSNKSCKDEVNFIKPIELARLMGVHPNGHFYSALKRLQILDLLHMHKAMYYTVSDYGYILEFNWSLIESGGGL